MRKLWPLRPPAWQRALLVAYPFPNCSAVRRIPGIEATIRANDGTAERLLVSSNARPSAVSRRANAAPMSTVAFVMREVVMQGSVWAVGQGLRVLASRVRTAARSAAG